jgi:hypothetical protein
MKRLASRVFLLLLICACVADAAPKQPTIAVRGPTIIAFFPPVTQAELEKDTSGTNEALDDFQFYAAKVREPLSKSAIAFHQVYARSFRVTVGKRSTVFRPVKVEVGYYLVAPGKEPRIEYGVMTDADLLQAAREYFGIEK